MIEETGGSAFPGVDYIDQHGKKNPEGMTLRDYFAGKAMAAFINPDEWQSTVGDVSRNVAFNAYAMADAMLKAREE